MKKLLLTLLTVMCISPVFADQFAEKGLISGWKFAPVQVGVGIFESANLFDADSVSLFSFGFARVQQHSSIISLGGLTGLENNYAIQMSAASLAARNYGLMIGMYLNATGSGDNCGVKIGLFNVSGKFKLLQFLGINCFDLLHIGIANFNAPLQIGILNACGGGYDDRGINWQLGILNVAEDYDSSFTFQIGLLNYNLKSYIPWLPLINWDMGKRSESEFF